MKIQAITLLFAALVVASPLPHTRRVVNLEFVSLPCRLGTTIDLTSNINRVAEQTLEKLEQMYIPEALPTEQQILSGRMKASLKYQIFNKMLGPDIDRYVSVLSIIIESWC